MCLAKRVDKSTPLLLQPCTDGRNFKNVQLHFTTGGADKQTYLSYKLKDVIVTSYSFHVNPAPSPRPMPEPRAACVLFVLAYARACMLLALTSCMHIAPIVTRASLNNKKHS